MNRESFFLKCFIVYSINQLLRFLGNTNIDLYVDIHVHVMH